MGKSHMDCLGHVKPPATDDPVRMAMGFQGKHSTQFTVLALD